MVRPSRRQQDGFGSEMGGVSLPLLMAVAFVSFFGGTLFTMHAGIDGCASLAGTSTNGGDSGSGTHTLNAKVEELAQKRLLGTYTSAWG